MNPIPEQQSKLPPQSLEAERAVLGACLLDSQAANDVRALLKAEDFYAPQHQLLYSSIVRLIDSGRPADPVTVGDVLREAGDLERSGGMAYLSGLLDAVPARRRRLFITPLLSRRSPSSGLISTWPRSFRPISTKAAMKQPSCRQ